MALFSNLFRWFCTPKLPPEFEQLRRKLYDANYHVRVQAAKDLGRSGELRVSEYLLVRIQHGVADVHTTRAIHQALVELGNISTKPLIKAVRNRNPKIREAAISCLGEIKDKAAIRPLLAALNDPDDNVRCKSAGALGDIGDSRALEPLVSLLTHPISTRAAVFALRKLGDSRAIDPLIKAFKSCKIDDYKGEILVSIAEIGGAQALDFLINTTNDSNYRIRRMAESALAGRKFNGAAEFALNRLRDARPSGAEKKHIGYFQSLISDLENALILQGANISELTLCRAADLKDFEIVCESIRSPEMGVEPLEYVEKYSQTYRVEFSKVRQLAQEELGRRGKTP